MHRRLFVLPLLLFFGLTSISYRIHATAHNLMSAIKNLTVPHTSPPWFQVSFLLGCTLDGCRDWELLFFFSLSCSLSSELQFNSIFRLILRTLSKEQSIFLRQPAAQ